MLCENPWEGGGGHDIRDVARWTLDQCWFRLCNKDLLAADSGRNKEVMPEEIVPQEDGSVKGRAKDGTPIKGVVRGKSVARMLMEEEEKKQEQEKSLKKKRGRRGRKKRKG